MHPEEQVWRIWGQPANQGADTRRPALGSKQDCGLQVTGFLPNGGEDLQAEGSHDFQAYLVLERTDRAFGLRDLNSMTPLNAEKTDMFDIKCL